MLAVQYALVAFPQSTFPPAALGRALVDDDAFFEYGYVWLPYAAAALVLLVLGGVAAVRWPSKIRRTAATGMLLVV